MIGKGARMLVPVTRNVMQSRAHSMSAISGPPTVHVSNAEKFILGGIMISSFVVYPVYVLLNLKRYRLGSAK